MKAKTTTNHRWRYRFATRRQQATRFCLPPRHQRAITLVEVLISMGILTIGLLSVAALFPVGGYYMRQGEVQDRGAAVAKAAFADIVARGMLKPESWKMWRDDAPGSMNFTGAVTDEIRKELTKLDRQQTFSAAPLGRPTPEMEMVKEIGSTFVLDPLAVASVTSSDKVNYLKPIRHFPARTFPTYMGNNFTSGQNKWATWGGSWPVRRITVGGLNPAEPLSSTLAESLLSSHDDLVTESPGASNSVGIQQWESGASGTLKRSWKGDYSWIVTICPSTHEAHNDIALDPSAHKYHVSVVVFYKRPVLTSRSQDPSRTDLTRDDVEKNRDNLVETERSARGIILSSSSSGGEILLEQPGQLPDEEIFEELKAGQWLMLSGPHPSSRDDRPMFFSRWYRVVAVEGKHSPVDSYSRKEGNKNRPMQRRLVTLRGPAWPWEPAQRDQLRNPALVQNNLLVGIFPSAVAVHSRTMRLEGGAGNNQ